MTQHIKNVTDQDFNEEVLSSDIPVLVDFWAEWCGPCKMLSPILDQVAAKITNVKIVKLNVDNNPNSPAQYSIRSIPALLLFKDGTVVSTKFGAMSESQLIEFINSNI